jgi:hypothetical protein
MRTLTQLLSLHPTRNTPHTPQHPPPLRRCSLNSPPSPLTPLNPCSLHLPPRTGRKVWLDVARRVQLERERESYKRAHGGKEAPLSFVERFFGCLFRQRLGKKRARKPPSAKDTAMKKASQMTAAVAAESDSAKDTTGSQLRREARGTSSVGQYKKNAVGGSGTPGTPSK